MKILCKRAEFPELSGRFSRNKIWCTIGHDSADESSTEKQI